MISYSDENAALMRSPGIVEHFWLPTHERHVLFSGLFNPSLETFELLDVKLTKMSKFPVLFVPAT